MMANVRTMWDEGLTIVNLLAKDVRFPTSEDYHGSDAMHSDPDYSCAYVIIETKNGKKGYGLTFTLGRGTEVVVRAIQALSHIVLDKNAAQIFSNFAETWRRITSESQLRWLGPEKGVVHLAASAIVNALWDLWARLEEKPLWKLLCDMDPRVLVSTIDFGYITDLITPEECVAILEDSMNSREKREKDLAVEGYPAYTTQVGWLGYSDAEVQRLCENYLSQGFSAFKIKVGQNVEWDKKRCERARRAIGFQNLLMLDANQKWDTKEAISWIAQLEEYRPYWIEEPTSPDDILGHATISEELSKKGIKVASGEMCANRVMFKQFLQAKAFQVCQIDATRLGGVNEVLAVYFMAKKLDVPVCPHAGGVGLCEMVRHLQFFDYICLTGTTENRMIEYVDKHHEYFTDPALVVSGRYALSKAPGYSTEFDEKVFDSFEFPHGKVWRKKEHFHRS